MKKSYLAAVVFAVALGATACSGNSDNTATTAAPTTEAATQATQPATTAEESTEEEEDYIEEDYVTGVITKIEDNILTVKNNDDDSEKKYDISKAEVSQEYPFSEGDTVEITFPYETTEDPVPAIAVDVMESIIGQNTDPSVTGTVVESSVATLTLSLENGETCKLNITNAYIVAKDGITPDQEATITYIGDLDDNSAMAVKVVMEDSYGTAEAERNAFIGKVIQNTGSNLVLESEDSDFYTFVSNDLDFSSYEVGDILQIFYSGTITAKEITAEEVIKK